MKKKRSFLKNFAMNIIPLLYFVACIKGTYWGLTYVFNLVKEYLSIPFKDYTFILGVKFICSGCGMIMIATMIVVEAVLAIFFLAGIFKREDEYVV